MTRGLVAKIVLSALAVLACVDDAEAGRRRKRGSDCCCEGGSSSGYSSSGMYSNAYASSCSCQQTGGYASNTYPMPMGGGTTSGYGDPNQFGNVQFSIAGAGAVAADKARVRIQLPTAETRLWINNQQVQPGSTDRSFDISLPANQPMKYTLTAQWVKDGREVVRKKEVEIRQGQESTVAFSDADEAASEQVPTNPNVSPRPISPPIRPDNGLPKPDRP
jgi:uncharacterized protein (TIGR03000 family)